MERALAQADRADAEEERIEATGAAAALGLIVAIAAVPAVAVSVITGSKFGWLWIVAGILGAAPVLKVLRRSIVARRLAQNPLPPPRPTTQMWLDSDDAKSDVA